MSVSPGGGAAGGATSGAGGRAAHLPAGPAGRRVGRLGEAVAGAASSPRAVAAFALGLALPLYLALEGGGYEEVLRDQVALALWWVAIAGLIVGALPVARPSRMQLAGLGALAAFAIWTGVGALWSLSPGRTVSELARICCYLAVATLAVLTVTRETRRHLLGGVLCAIVAVSLLSLGSRLHPGWFAAGETAQFLAGARSRLNWPINYWNGLAAFVAIGAPIAVHFATQARRLLVRGLVAMAMPAMAAVIYLTFSRGGWIELAVGVVALVALGSRRGWTLLSIAIGALGSWLLIAAIHQRPAVNSGLGGHPHQGDTLTLITVVVCVGVGLLQWAVVLVERNRAGSWGALRPRSQLRRPPAPAVAAAVVAATAVVFLLAGGPGHVSHAWSSFAGTGASAATSGAPSSRLFTLSGEGRWQMWVSCLEAFTGHPAGIGAGTFQLWWAAHGSIFGYVINAHSLYFETLAETGLPGILLLAAFLVAGFRGALKRIGWGGREDRSLQAATVAAALAFCVAALYDWVWQIPALPVLLLLLFAAGAAGAGQRVRRGRPMGGGRGVDGARGVGGLPLTGRGRACLAVAGALAGGAIAWSMTGQVSLRESRAAAQGGALPSALSDARKAGSVQPFSSEPPLQQALVLERRRHFAAAAAAAKEAIANAPEDWRSWVVSSRIEAERGNPRRALSDWRRARSLDPRDPLFKNG